MPPFALHASSLNPSLRQRRHQHAVSLAKAINRYWSGESYQTPADMFSSAGLGKSASKRCVWVRECFPAFLEERFQIIRLFFSWVWSVGLQLSSGAEGAEGFLRRDTSPSYLLYVPSPNWDLSSFISRRLQHQISLSLPRRAMKSTNIDHIRLFSSSFLHRSSPRSDLWLHG